MASNETRGYVLRVLPDRRVVVRVGSREITASAFGVSPRPGADVLIANTGAGWQVLSWQ